MSEWRQFSAARLGKDEPLRDATNDQTLDFVFFGSGRRLERVLGSVFPLDQSGRFVLFVGDVDEPKIISRGEFKFGQFSRLCPITT